MHYPKPDRSDQTRNFKKTADDPALDIGWNEGFLSDGRQYRVECWCEDQMTLLTYFFSTAGLEQMTDAQAADLLEREGLLAYRPGVPREASAMPWTDASGNSHWSVNVVVGVDEDTFIDDRVGLRPYARPVD